MKRYIVLIIVLAMAISCLACPAYAIFPGTGDDLGEDLLPENVTFNETTIAESGYFIVTFECEDGITYVSDPVYMEGTDTLATGKYASYEVTFRVGGETYYTAIETIQGSYIVLLLFNGFSGNPTLAAVVGETEPPATEPPADGTYDDIFTPVTDGLTSVIRLLGTVTTSLISGELSPLLPLLAVGIAVSFIFLSIKVVKRFIWGS